MSDLLPPNATPAERAIEQATARVGAVPVRVRDVWNPAACPPEALPWLAWALSVENWSSDWDDEDKRAVIAASIDVHRRKGTVGAVRRALAAAGYGGSKIVENFGTETHNGVHLRDGSIGYGDPDHWAEYRVYLTRPMTNAQAAIVRDILADVAPLRSHLKALDFVEVAHLHDGKIKRDGSFNYGVA